MKNKDVFLILIVGAVLFVGVQNARGEDSCDQFLCITGTKDSQGKVYVGFMMPLDYDNFGSDLHKKDKPRAQENPYTLELLDKENSLINKYDLEIGPITYTDVGTDTRESNGFSQGRDEYFSCCVPYGPSVNKVVIKGKGDIVFEKTRSPHPPVVKIDQPQNNARISGAVNVSWTGSDQDGDRLMYRLESRAHDYDKDGGGTVYLGWDAVLSGKIEKIDAGRNTLRVLATDGLNTSTDSVEVFVDNPLEVRLCDPSNGGKDISLDFDLTLTFNNALKKESLNSRSIQVLENGITLVEHGECKFIDKNIIECAIGQGGFAPLKPGTSYTVKLTTAIEDIYGGHLGKDYTFTFTTRK
jgi:hypothetical protein